MKMSDFIIGIVLVCMFIVGFSVFTSDVVTYTGESANWNATELEMMDKFSEINSTVAEIQTVSYNTSTDRGLGDIVGSIYLDTKAVLLTSEQSMNTFTNMGNMLFDVLGISVFWKYIIVIVLILIILGVIIATLVGRDDL